MIKNLQLTPHIHKKQAIIRADFAYDRVLVDLVKKQKGVRWSQSLKAWYFIEKDFQLNRFYQALKGIAFIDYSQLKKPFPRSSLSKKSSKEFKSEIQLPKGFKEQLILKRYSQNTVKTYCSCLLKFKDYFKGQKIDSLSKEEINSFLLHLIQEKKVSPSTQNQYINAIKFYYEKVLRRYFAPKFQQLKMANFKYCGIIIFKNKCCRVLAPLFVFLVKENWFIKNDNSN